MIRIMAVLFFVCSLNAQEDVVILKGKPTMEETAVPMELSDLKRVLNKKDLVIEYLEGPMPNYLNNFLECESEERAKILFKEHQKTLGGQYSFLLESYDYFFSHWHKKNFADSIIEQHKSMFEGNLKALKALAYVYQAQGRKEKANNVYKKIFVLAPNEIQSYMDLANSYREVGEFKKAASLYARYAELKKRGILMGQRDSEEVISRDSENFFGLKSKVLLSEDRFENKNINSSFKGTRLVFEWNTSEAMFNLTFKNPAGHGYTWENSSIEHHKGSQNKKNPDLSTKEYLIYNFLRGNWQVYLEYHGNNSTAPTYLKVSIYQNYGTEYQSKETKLFKVATVNESQHLFSVSNVLSLVSN